MGTRNLTCVCQDDEFKAVKYCQWDGSPGYAGVEIVHFLNKEFEPELFREQLSKTRIFSPEEIIALTTEFGGDPINGGLTWDESKKFGEKHPQLIRDTTGADFLRYLQTSEYPAVKTNNPSFAKDSLFCEWCYVVDLDKNTFEVYKGFNKLPLSEDDRFYFLQKDLGDSCNDSYYPVSLEKTFDISSNIVNEFEAWLVERNREDS